MAESYRSIFRQKYCEKLYKIEKGWSSLRDTGYLKEFAGILIKEEIICTCDVEIPMLEPGEQFFLADIQKEVIIKSRMRSSDGSIVYYVENELVDTENTERTLRECNEMFSENKRLEDNYDKLREKFENYTKEYKYKHRWLNFFLD